MAKFDFDLFVIGAGSGGVRAARIAAGHGARVAIAEEHRYGGTCVIRGCVPKKLLVYASRFADDFEDAAGFGWSVPVAKFDWTSMVSAKDAEIGRLEKIYLSVLDRAGVAHYRERATIAGRHEIRLETSGQSLTAERILVATGATPNLDLTVPGIEHAITSNEAFDLPTLPEHIVIVGGGYIAIEFACIFKGLGSEVTLVHRGEHFLRGFDDDLRAGLATALKSRGIDIRAASVIRRIETSSSVLKGRAISAELSNGDRVTASHVMYAIGRRPNTDQLGLGTAGVQIRDSGAIAVSAGSQTSVSSIFAVGDVTDRMALTPVAIREGHAFADSIYGTKAWSVDYTTVPTAVFSTPEIGTVGLAEHEARALHGAIDIYKASFRTMKSIMAKRDERIMMKLVVARDSDRVLGVHILGPDAAEIVQIAAISLRLGATKADFDATMALHPSIAEELVTLRERWIAPGEAAG